MASNAFKIDSRMKKYQRVTGYIKWEHELMMRGHLRRLQEIKPAIDNKCPNRGPFYTLNAKRMRLHEDKVKKIERKNRLIVKRLRAINEVKLPEFCHWKLRARMRGDAFRLKPPSGRKAYRFDWEALKGSTERRSLRKQEKILRRLIHSTKITPEEAKLLKKYLPKHQEMPIEYLDYHKRELPEDSGVVAKDVKYVETDEAEGILTKIAALRLHMHYGEWNPGVDSPYLDFASKHKKLL